MFGRRPDGKPLKTLSPFFKLIPLIMDRKCDSQVQAKYDLDYSSMKEYINTKKKEGINISAMSIIIAAYVRLVAEYPQLNRFIVNKRIYKRNSLSVAFTSLKKTPYGEDEETVIMINLKLTDTVFDVNKKILEEIEKNKREDYENSADKLVEIFMKVPVIPRLLVNIVKLLDKHGLAPNALIKESPFHASLFLTNMTSIRMNFVYHHLYEFGTSSVFISMGEIMKKADSEKKTLAMGVTIDDRICPGIIYAKANFSLKKYLKNPELLELPIENIIKDID